MFEVVVPSENTYKVPLNMPLNIAAGFPVTYGTAYSALTSAKLKEVKRAILEQQEERITAVDNSFRFKSSCLWRK